MSFVKLGGIEFTSPILVASGTYGYGHESAQIVDVNKIGGIVTKSVTRHPREGNPPPRITETSSGMLNSIGLANLGVEEYCQSKLPYLNELKTNVIINVAGTAIDDYVETLQILENSGGNHVGYEINISCPNVKDGGMEFGVDKETTYRLISEIRQLTNKIIIVKLTPNVTDISEIAIAAENAGADAISAVNTFQGLSIDYLTGKMLLSTKIGGVSGPPIKPLALAKINKIYEKVKIPIIGMGGISNIQDIIEFIRVGSSMIQVGTLNYRDPSIICTFYDKLVQFLNKKNISDLSDLIGNYH